MQEHYCLLFGKSGRSLADQMDDFRASRGTAALTWTVTGLLTFVTFRTKRAKRCVSQRNGKAEKIAAPLSHNGNGSLRWTARQPRLESRRESRARETLVIRGC